MTTPDIHSEDSRVVGESGEKLGVAASPEEWRTIPGLSGLYEVSNLGQVRSSARGIARLLRGTPDGKGYLRVNIGGRHQKVHRLVCLAFHGPAPTDEYEVGHRDGNRANNAAANVRWVTRQVNADDKFGHGTHYVQPPKEAMPRGERHPHAKFSDEKIAAIKADRLAGYSYRRLAQRHGVDPGHACRIVNGKARA